MGLSAKIAGEMYWKKLSVQLKKFPLPQIHAQASYVHDPSLSPQPTTSHSLFLNCGMMAIYIGVCKTSSSIKFHNKCTASHEMWYEILWLDRLYTYCEICENIHKMRKMRNIVKYFASLFSSHITIACRINAQTEPTCIEFFIYNRTD